MLQLGPKGAAHGRLVAPFTIAPVFADPVAEGGYLFFYDLVSKDGSINVIELFEISTTSTPVLKAA